MCNADKAATVPSDKIATQREQKAGVCVSSIHGIIYMKATGVVTADCL
jgi:hypothetical protein